MNLDRLDHQFQTYAASLEEWGISLDSNRSGLTLTGPNGFIAHFDNYKEIDAFILGLQHIRDSR